jgi:protein ImuB
LRLIASHLPPFVSAGRDLFDDRPAQAVPWEQLRERLRARLGDDAVYQLAARTDPRPERAWQRDDGSPASAPLDRPRRPTWLLKRPIPLRDANPIVLAGPERLESGWWDGEDARRDYYVLQTTQGQHAWAFSAVGECGPWMLHGWFA